MLFQLYKRSILAIFLVAAFSLQLFAQGNGTVKPYSAQATALKGETNTDLTLTFFTNNGAKFPIPAELKKLQIKIRNQAGEIAYIHNAKALGLNGNVYKTSIAGPQNHNILEFQAHIKTAATKNEEIVTGTVVTKLYPNFKVETVTAPAEKKINEPFNIEAFITETNLQTGGTFTVSLYKEGSLAASYTNVAVAAGGNASVVFGNLTHNTVGTQNYSVVISNTVPGDYDAADNSKSVAVNFINPVSNVAQTNYWLNYNRTDNYNYNQVGINYYGQQVYSYNQTGDFEDFSYGVYNNGINITSTNLPLSASYKIETSDNRIISGTFENIAPNYYYYYYQYYWAFDPVNFVHFNGYIDIYGYVQAYIYRYRSNYVYYYNYMDGYNYYYENRDPLNTFINENSQLKVSLVATYDNYSFGGGAVLNVNSPQHYSYNYNYSYYDYTYGNVDYSYSNSYDYTNNYSNGLTDVNMLPKMAVTEKPVLASAVEVPAQFGMDQNYPNPFNPATTINYAIPEASFVTLKVYNITGEEVATLVNRVVSAGYHSVNFDAKGLASGTYIYRIQAGNNVKTYKMLLMK